MATNPMQRKAKNAFLGGIATMLLISIILGAIGVYQYIKLDDAKKLLEANLKSVYILSQDLNSGAIITEDMFTIKKVDQRTVPEDAVNPEELVDYSLVDTNNNPVYTMDLNEKKVNEGSQTVQLLKDKETGKYYKMVNNEKVATDYTGLYINATDETGSEKTLLIHQKEDGTYYVVKGNQNENIEFKNAPLIAKIDMKANTAVTPSMIVRSDEILKDDIREQQYSMIVLPEQLKIDSYVDIRLQLPNGQDFIVVSKKRIKNTNEDTIWIDMKEEEILLMSNAIVENYVVKGSKLYASMYVEPGNQSQASLTYVPSYEVASLIKADINIVEKAKAEILNRYNANNESRTQIEGQINAYGEERKNNIETKIEEEVTKSQEIRKKYVEEIGLE